MGGGGDGGYGARQDADEARKAEARAKINALFGIGPAAPAQDPNAVGPAPISEAQRNKAGLDALYSKVRGDAFGASKRALDEQKTDQTRNLKFELFARGLRGGSADIDQNARLGRAYTDGLTRIGAQADGLVSDLRSNDEQTRLGLLQGISSGMDQGSAMSSALSQLRNNSERAYSEAQGQSFGDLLGLGAGIYGQNQRAKGQQRAQSLWASQMPRRGAQPMITQDGG